MGATSAGSAKRDGKRTLVGVAPPAAAAKDARKDSAKDSKKPEPPKPDTAKKESIRPRPPATPFKNALEEMAKKKAGAGAGAGAAHGFDPNKTAPMGGSGSPSAPPPISERAPASAPPMTRRMDSKPPPPLPSASKRPSVPYVAPTSITKPLDKATLAAAKPLVSTLKIPAESKSDPPRAADAMRPPMPSKPPPPLPSASSIPAPGPNVSIAAIARGSVPEPALPRLPAVDAYAPIPIPLPIPPGMTGPPMPLPMPTTRGLGDPRASVPDVSNPGAYSAPPPIPVPVPATVPLAAPIAPPVMIARPPTRDPMPDLTQRAYSAWSSDQVLPVAPDEPARERDLFDELPPDAAEVAGQLSYQVYRPADLQKPRAPSRVDLDAFAREGSKKSLHAKIGLGIVAFLVVVTTAIVIVLGSADEPPPSLAPKDPTPAVTVPPPLPTPTIADTSALTPIVAPDPDPPAPDPTPAPTPTAKRPRAPVSAAVRTATPPPNPYGGTPPSALKPPKK